MAKDPMENLIACLRKAALAGGKCDRTDGELLEDYIRRRDEAAVAALVGRHGPMVWGVCRRILGNHHDAEDAFQATFLVLVRKAASIMPREMIGNWLYGVAHRTALKARAMAAKRQARERQVKELPEPEAMPESALWSDLERLLDQELSRLPDKYRIAIVLCDLEGKTCKEAARQLKIPEGTLSTRLRTARTMLTKRLARHGLGVSGGALAAVLSQKMASACVPTSMVSSTIKAATLFAAGLSAASGAISVNVAALTEGVLTTMLLSKFKIASVVLLGVMAGLAVGGFLHRTQAADPAREKVTQAADPASAREAQALKQVEKPNSDKVLSGGEVLSTFDQNEARGDEKFIGKKLRVSGKVFKVERVALADRVNMSRLKESDEQYYLLIFSAEPSDGKKTEGSDNPKTIPIPIAFIFPISGRKQLAELQKGQRVTVEGVCQGRKGEVRYCVIFTVCEIVKNK